MQVYQYKDYRTNHLCTITSYYYTPRAILIELLDDERNSDFIYWLDKGKTFRIIDENKVADFWSNRSLKNGCVWKVWELFEPEILGSVQRFYKGSLWSDYKIFTKSTEKRPYIDDLVPGKFHEWIIRFLLEESRMDLIQWENKEELEFRILNSEQFGETFSNINGLFTKNPSFIVKFMLSSYCKVGILIEIDKEALHYRFDRKWYQSEINRMPNGFQHYQTEMTRKTRSQRLFPDLTIFESSV